MKLLIVDDNASMRGLIKDFFIQETVQVTECADGAQALAAYEKSRPDWVLMDIQMPVMGGLEAARRIKALDPLAQILIVTDFPDAELRTEAQKAGACGYVLKDDLGQLRRMIVAVQPSIPAV